VLKPDGAHINHYSSELCFPPISPDIFVRAFALNRGRNTCNLHQLSAGIRRRSRRNTSCYIRRCEYTLLTSRHDLFRSRRRTRLWTATIVCWLNLFIFSLFLAKAKLNDYFTCPSFNSPNLHSNLEMWRAGGTKAGSRYFFHPVRYFKDKNCCCAELYISDNYNRPAAHNVRRQKRNLAQLTQIPPLTSSQHYSCLHNCIFVRCFPKQQQQKIARSFPLSMPHVADLPMNVAL
jgi:hypothetical protein